MQFKRWNSRIRESIDLTIQFYHGIKNRNGFALGTFLIGFKTYFISLLVFFFATFPLMGMSVVTACCAPVPNEMSGDLMTQDSTRRDVPNTREKTAPILQESATPRPPVGVEVTPPPAPPPAGTEATPPSTNQAQPLPPCQGITATISALVQEFLTCDVIQILAKPDRVKSFKVKPVPDTSVPEQQRLWNYPMEPNGEGIEPNAEQLKNLQALIFSENSYVFGAEKRCRFRPEMGLRFIKGIETVDVLFSFSCDLWLFVYKGEEKLEDFDSVREKLVQLRNSLFPVNNRNTGGR